MAKQKFNPNDTRVIGAGMKLEEVAENWSLQPESFMEWMFHALKQELHFIQRKPDRVAMAELKAFVATNPSAVEAIFYDYHDNTEMRTLKYTKGGLIAFKKYYEAMLEEDEIKLD